jgi:hypothetical protein
MKNTSGPASHAQSQTLNFRDSASEIDLRFMLNSAEAIPAIGKSEPQVGEIIVSGSITPFF